MALTAHLNLQIAPEILRDPEVPVDVRLALVALLARLVGGLDLEDGPHSLVLTFDVEGGEVNIDQLAGDEDEDDNDDEDDAAPTGRRRGLFAWLLDDDETDADEDGSWFEDADDSETRENPAMLEVHTMPRS